MTLSDTVGQYMGSLVVPDAGGLSGHLSLSPVEMPQGIGPGTPSDTRTRSQRAADDAAGLTYDPATGGYTRGAPMLANKVGNVITNASSSVWSWIGTQTKNVAIWALVLILGVLFVILGAYIVTKD